MSVRRVNSQYAGKLRRETDFEWYWRIQNGCCAICGNAFIDSTSAHVDHDHGTGKTRGLLCMLCNTGIGSLRDSIVVLKAAIRYLDGTYAEQIRHNRKY